MKFTMQRLLGAQRSRSAGLCLTLALGTTSLVCHAQVQNGSFVSPVVTASEGWEFPSVVTGWKTTDDKKVFEIWKSGTMDPYSKRKIDAPPGIKQFAEVAAYSHGTLSQEVNGIPANSPYGFSFWHRGRHSGDTDEDTIEVTVKDGNNFPWKGRFFTTAKEWRQYTVSVGTKKGNGPVTLSFESIDTASKNPGAGNFLTGIRLDATVKPPPCVTNVGGIYDWTTDATKRNIGQDKPMTGVVTLSVGSKQASIPGRTGIWQVTSDCKVLIDWEPGSFRDELTATSDGKTLTGKNQFGTIITGVRK